MDAMLSVAPMMDWTDLHYRQLARLLSKHTWLWTEMVVDKTIIHCTNRDKFLWFPPEQRPVVLQLGGSDPETLAQAAKVVDAYGYDEINLNCGCPSDRVAGAGCFGAALMLQPDLVARCMAALSSSVSCPVSVKCRLGVDSTDTYQELTHFISAVSSASPTEHFIVHARKCHLHGLNPHQNRTIPPLRHDWVHSLAVQFPHLSFTVNGGVQSCYDVAEILSVAQTSAGAGASAGVCEDIMSSPAASIGAEASASAGPGIGAGDDILPMAGASNVGETGSQASPGSAAVTFTAYGGRTAAALAPGAGPAGPSGRGYVQGVMVGRAAYNDPWGVLADADRAVFGAASNPATSRRQVLRDYAAYADAMLGRWGQKPGSGGMLVLDPGVRALVKPLLNLFHGEAGSKRWKNAVDTELKGNVPSVAALLERTLHHIPDEVLDAPPRTRRVQEGEAAGVANASAGTSASDVMDRPGGGLRFGYTIGAFPLPGDHAGDEKPLRARDMKRARGAAVAAELASPPVVSSGPEGARVEAVEAVAVR